MKSELQLLIDSINHIANGCIIAAALFFGITVLKMYLFKKVESHLSESVAKRIEKILEWSSLLIFNFGVLWAIMFY